VTSEQPAPDSAYLNRAVEVSIRVFLFALLTVACLFILRPFIAMVVWGLIISIACYPGYCKLRELLGGKRGLASVLFTVLLLMVLIVPIALLTHTLIAGFQSTSQGGPCSASH
jgi:predicted PurR-regulated permease PerM